MKSASIGFFAPCLLVSITACSNAGQLVPGERSEAALIPLGSCDEVETAVRSAAVRAMNDLIDERLESDLAALSQGRCYNYSGGLEGGFSTGVGSPRTPVPTVPKQVSQTNNQVAGVDEADFVKNDDQYLYVIAGQRLSIIAAWPPEEARVVSALELADQPKRMFVEGDRLLVYSSVPKSTEEVSEYDTWWRQSRGECSYGYDCDLTGDGNGTRLTVYDIADRAAPQLLRTVETSATFISARRIGNAVHTVLYQEPEFLRRLAMTPPELAQGLCTGKRTEISNGNSYEVPVPAAGDRARVNAAYESLRATNVEAINSAPIEALLGTLRDDLGDPSPDAALHACKGFYDSPHADGVAFLSLMSLDLGTESAVRSSTIVSRPGASYAADDAYYIAVRQNADSGIYYQELKDEAESSTLHKFDLSGASNRYAASGLVKGRVLNQFAMDQADDYLRIATTSGHVPDPAVHSTLSTLRRVGSRLELAGQIDQIAPTEDIRSVRFVGDRAYIVTFKKTDPLFVFDLSDPESPRALGELKIPGFSTYLHQLDDEHLVSIGYDAADQGDFAWFTGLALQIFDVADAESPALAHKEVIGTRGSSSEAATNHLAFNYFAPKQLLALPVTVCEGGGTDGTYGTDMTFSGVMFYRIDAQAGFSLVGRTEHPYSSASSYTGNACTNWWTDSNSIVKRTVFMDYFAYSISDVRLKINDTRDLASDIAVIDLK